MSNIELDITMEKMTDKKWPLLVVFDAEGNKITINPAVSDPEVVDAVAHLLFYAAFTEFILTESASIPLSRNFKQNMLQAHIVSILSAIPGRLQELTDIYWKRLSTISGLTKEDLGEEYQ